MYGTHVLLHISVFLFFWALSDFFYTVDHHFGLVARYALVTASIVYVLLSISPLIFSDSPYNTPMTPPLRAGYIILRIIIRFPKWFPEWYRSQPFDMTGLKYYQRIHFDRARLYSIMAETWAEKLEPYAMKWLFTEDDFSDEDMDKFLEGLPGYMSSSHTVERQLDHSLTADHVLSRIREHFISCATSVELSDEARIARVSSCAKALMRISQYSRKRKEETSVPGEFKEESQETYNQGLMDYCKMLCDMDDPMIVLRASCIRALALQDFLSQLIAQGRTTASKDSPSFPRSLIPMYKFLFPGDNTGIIHQLETGQTPKPEEIKTIRDNLLRDGPLVNLTKLAQAVRAGEHAPPSTLSFCWKALDILLTQLGTIHSKELTPAQHHFNKLHEDIRTYVRNEERGFHVMPLLDILDTVARGRRLSMVFSGHPKYHSRADVVFGKESLRNSDLLEAFAHCLPDFISKNPSELCKNFMETLVREDDLWTSLQVNLWNAQRSDSPTPEKLRIFEDCCTVVDLAFSVLEDSREVDWRAPEFGSLAQRWESFITHCFQGGFMGKATSFRVGIIKARFCKALLAQFSNDIENRPPSFRSQWDVASLARLISTLGLRDKDDPEFWISYVHGGSIGTEFTTKALEMINIAARDGPLLIFCILGRLVLTAVPLDQSGVGLGDIERVWGLLRKVIDEERLNLNRPSDTVWGDIGQLRKQVNDQSDNNTGEGGEDREILQKLLQMIDELREPADEQGRKTSVGVDATSESHDTSNRFSSASESTAVTGGQSSGGEDGSGRAYLFIKS
jgi:hypothetical protein